MAPKAPATPGVGQPSVLLSWTAPSHFNHERSLRWYVVGSLIIIGVSLYGIISGAWSLAIVSLLLGGVYFQVRREPMPLRDIRIEVDGVQFEDSFVPWAQCKDFWLIKTPLYTELHITRKARLKGDIRIQTGNIDPTVIRTTLSQFLLLREDQRENIIDIVLRLCKL